MFLCNVMVTIMSKIKERWNGGRIMSSLYLLVAIGKLEGINLLSSILGSLLFVLALLCAFVSLRH